jgi:hypothetical protein
VYPYISPSHEQAQPGRRILAFLLTIPVILSFAALWAFDRSSAHNSLYGLSNLIGPTVFSFLHGGGLTVCTDAMGTPTNPICFHAARMPMASLVVALGVRLFGDHFLSVASFKTILLLLPIEAAIFLAWRRLPRHGIRRILIVLLLLVPFGLTPLLADVVNMQVEEGYTYSFLTLAVAILFFCMKSPGSLKSGLLRAVLFAIAVDGLYLSKSAMLPVALVLTIAFVYQERRIALQTLLALLVVAAPAGWAVHQHHASGKYSVGTSIDGTNLHKGNNDLFLGQYPPQPGDSLDQIDYSLNWNLYFPDEWSFNDYHRTAAFAYMKAHPSRTLWGDLRKLQIIFFAIHKTGSSESHGLMLVVETAGFLLFRALLWIAITLSIVGILPVRRGSIRPRRTWAGHGLIFLALVAACAFPYVLGFAYSRHVSILIYPAVLMCCAVLMDRDKLSDGEGDLWPEEDRRSIPLAEIHDFSSEPEAVH